MTGATQENGKKAHFLQIHEETGKVIKQGYVFKPFATSLTPGEEVPPILRDTTVTRFENGGTEVKIRAYGGMQALFYEEPADLVQRRIHQKPTSERLPKFIRKPIDVLKQASLAVTVKRAQIVVSFKAVAKDGFIQGSNGL